MFTYWELISMVKMAVPSAVPMDLSRLTAEVFIPISLGSELFWTAAMTGVIMHPRPTPRTNCATQNMVRGLPRIS